MVSCGYSADDIKIIKSISQSVDGTSNNVVYKKNDNNNASFMNCLLTRERTINGGPYSYSVPGTDIVWPAPIPENERLFWRQSIEKYAHYHLEEFPLKRNNGMSEDIGDLAWRILLFSKYPNIDLLLYLKQDEMSFPIILLLREGKINAVDFRKLSSSPKVLQRKFLFQIASCGIDDFNLLVNKLEDSLVKFSVSENMYNNILSTFYLVNLSAKKASYKFNESMILYKTDINHVREMSGMPSRTTFNNGSSLVIQNRENISEYFMLELYNKNELPGLVQSVVYAMYNSCINPNENSFIVNSDLQKIKYKVSTLMIGCFISNWNISSSKLKGKML